MRKWCRLTCFENSLTQPRGGSTDGRDHKEAEVAKAKPSQNLPLHSKTTLNPYKFQQKKPNQ